MDRGAWGGGVCGYSSWGHKELDMTEQLTLSKGAVCVFDHGIMN